MYYPKISIIIPIFNTQVFLDRCIKSVINQKYNNLEIILVNDGSTDNSLKICKKYSKVDSRIVLIDKENGGVSSARNAGLDKASGDYIGFVDSDDYIDRNMYQKMIEKALEENADIIECGYLTCDENGKNQKQYKLKGEVIDDNYKCCYSYLAKNNTTNFNVNKLYRNSIIKDIRYPNYKYSEDYWFNAKTFHNCKKKVTLHDSFYFYVQNPNSAVNKAFDIESKMDVFNAGEDIYNFYLDKYPSLTSLIALYICNYVLNYYFQIEKENMKVESLYFEKMNNLFKKYYPKIQGEVLKKIRFKSTRLFLLLYRIHPKLFSFGKKLSYLIRH